MSFWMADAKDGGKVLEAYKCAIENEADAVRVGDLVKVTGQLTKYNTTPEFAAGCTVEIIERGGEEPPVIDDVITCAQAVELANNGSSAEVTIEGYVTEIIEAWSDYKNVSFWMADEANGGQVFEAFRVNCENEADAPRVGDLVRVRGTLQLYNGTPETKKGGTFEIIARQGVENTAATVKAVKVIRDGQVIILKGDKTFNVLGTELK
jgi:DNA/RNA endonuclease YhcR with UshA esterase domain